MSGAETDGYGSAVIRNGGPALLFPLRQVMRNLWILGHLLYLSAEDIWEGKISMKVIAGLFCTGLLYGVMQGLLPQFLPGMAVLLIGRISREQIGYGDGWLLMALGTWMGLTELLHIFFLGTGLAMLYAFFFRKKELPLVPFLTAAYVIGEWL